jgi:hypothetical protein
MRRAGAVLAPLLAVLVAGCGSAELSDVQLRNRATRLCSTANRQADRIVTPATPSAAVAYLDRGIAVFRPELARLRTLRPPSDLATVYRTSVGAFSQELSALELTVRKLHGGADPVSAMRTLERHLAPLEATEDTAWTSLHVPACIDR